jgi:MFS family permease
MNLSEQISLERKNILILSLCQAFFMSMNSILLTIDPLIGYILSEEKSQSTLPIALFQLAGMLAIFPASFAMKKFGRRQGFILGVLIGTIGTIAGIYGIHIKSFWFFAIATFFIGIYNGFSGFYIFAAADSVRKPFQSRAISFVMAGGVLAALIGPLLVVWMQKAVDSSLYMGPFISILLFQILTLFILLFLNIPDLHEENNRQECRPIIQIIKQSKFILSILGGMCGNGLMVFVMTASPLAMTSHQHNIDDTAFIMQLHLLGMFTPSFFSGYLIDKFNAMRMMIYGLVIILVAIIINTTIFSLINMSFSLFLLGLGWNFMNISSTTLLIEACAAEDQAIIQAIYEFFIVSTMAFFVYLSGWSMNNFGWIMLNFSGIPILLILLIGITLTLPRKRLLNV